MWLKQPSICTSRLLSAQLEFRFEISFTLLWPFRDFWSDDPPAALLAVEAVSCATPLGKKGFGCSKLGGAMELKINIYIYMPTRRQSLLQTVCFLCFVWTVCVWAMFANLQFVALRWRFEALQPLDVHLPLWRWARRGIEGLGRAAKWEPMAGTVSSTWLDETGWLVMSFLKFRECSLRVEESFTFWWQKFLPTLLAVKFLEKTRSQIN